ncbi:hypothetical protein [Aliivibrio salmonicida]|uniref:hypothetical protein n=1 Tax=Aliivibrio salmonicida TaxID=40269 RepID=UPI003D12E7B3
MVFELILYLLIFGSASFLLFPKFGLLNQRIALDANYQYTALKQAAKVTPLTFFLLLNAIINHVPWFFLPLYLLLPTLLLTIPLIARKHRHSLLAVETSIIQPHHVRIHLSTIDQAFNRQTFIELLQLTDLLKKKGITTITLSSPLFFKGKKQRAMHHFITQLEKHHITVQSKASHWVTFPLGTLMLMYYKHLKKSPSLTNTPLTHWHTYTLHL